MKETNLAKPTGRSASGAKIVVTADEPAVKYLWRFFAALRKWELQAHTTSEKMLSAGSDQEIVRFRKTVRKALEKLFETYCEAGKGARRLRDAGMSWSHPPEYDPARDRIISVSERNGVVTVDVLLQSYQVFVFRYQIVRDGRRWRIRDNRKRRLKEESRWKADLL